MTKDDFWAGEHARGELGHNIQVFSSLKTSSSWFFIKFLSLVWVAKHLSVRDEHMRLILLIIMMWTMYWIMLYFITCLFLFYV